MSEKEKSKVYINKLQCNCPNNICNFGVVVKTGSQYCLSCKYKKVIIPNDYIICEKQPSLLPTKVLN